MYTHIHTPTYQKKNQHIKELQRTPTVHTAHKTPSDLHTRTDYTNMSLKKKKREKLSATLMPPTTGLAPPLLLNDFAEKKKKEKRQQQNTHRSTLKIRSNQPESVSQDARIHIGSSWRRRTPENKHTCGVIDAGR